MRLHQRELSADCDTPLSVFARLRADGDCFLFESAEGGEHWGRFSIIGFESACIAIERDGALQLSHRDGRRETLAGDDMLAWLRREIIQAEAVDAGDLPFSGGAVGYFSYEMVRRFEPLNSRHDLGSAQPIAAFLLVDRFVIFDSLRGTMTLCVRSGDSQEAAARLDAIETRLSGASLPAMRLAPTDAGQQPAAQMP